MPAIAETKPRNTIAETMPKVNEYILARQGFSFTAKEVADETGCDQRTVYATLEKIASTDWRLILDKSKKRGKRWSYVDLENQCAPLAESREIQPAAGPEMTFMMLVAAIDRLSSAIEKAL